MIDLYTWSTPNGRKITIILEELKVPYTIFPIDIDKNDQFSDKFSRISPTNKIPVIIDNENKKTIFESGTIMIYLAEKYNKFIPQKYHWQTMEWLMFQISQVGPLLGQAHQFLFYHPNQSKFIQEKYINYTIRIYQTLDDRLKDNEYLAKEYSIADISTWPWIARFEKQRISLNDYPNVLRWYSSIMKRPAVVKGYNAVGNKEKIPF